MRVEKTGFGYIVVDGMTYKHDVVLTDKISARRKELSAGMRREFGHTPLTDKEILEYFSDYRPEVIVVGTGQFGALPLVEVEEAAKELDAELVVERTPSAIDAYNKLKEEGKRVAAVFHVTC